MSLKIEPRRGVSWQMQYATPVLAVALTILTGFILFLFMGYNPFQALMSYFVSPLLSLNGLSELGVKAAPLITIAIGLAVGFRANVWNIGAEGQYTIGAILGGGVGLALYGDGNPLTFPAMMLGGQTGGQTIANLQLESACLSAQHQRNQPKEWPDAGGAPTSECQVRY